MWRDEFGLAYAEGGLFQLTMHPHVIGHRSRIVALNELIEYMAGHDVWFATHAEAARYVAEQARRGGSPWPRPRGGPVARPSRRSAPPPRRPPPPRPPTAPTPSPCAAAAPSTPGT